MMNFLVRICAVLCRLIRCLRSARIIRWILVSASDQEEDSSLMMNFLMRMSVVLCRLIRCLRSAGRNGDRKDRNTKLFPACRNPCVWNARGTPPSVGYLTSKAPPWQTGRHFWHLRGTQMMSGHWGELLLLSEYWWQHLVRVWILMKMCVICACRLSWNVLFFQSWCIFTFIHQLNL